MPLPLLHESSLQRGSLHLDGAPDTDAMRLNQQQLPPMVLSVGLAAQVSCQPLRNLSEHLRPVSHL